ncbi:Tonsoku-like protein [Lamellibrachia satsuma]|nr:Tonsoku-like protein [Lamellibrachia satsuma]
MEGIERKSYSAAVIEGERKRARVFVGDSIVRKTDRVLNKGDHVVVCLPGAKIEAITERVLATVTSWDLLPLPTRYAQACQSLKTTSYRNIRNQLQACASSNDLDLTDLALRSQRFLPVARALQCEHRLKELHLSGNRLGDSGLESLCQIAPTIPNLGTLNLACNEITQVGLKKLADCLQVLPSDGKEAPFQVLEVLNLSFNPLGDSCMLSLAMVLHKLSALSTLGLASCDFTQKLFQHHRLALAESMQDHHLQSVDFSSNQLSSMGVELLLMCCKASTLQSINISSVVSSYHGNYIAKHVQAFVSQSDCALETLVLRDCRLSPGCLPDICRVLTDAKFLHTLDLSANGKLNGLTLTALLTEAARCATCRLTVLRCCGCTMSSPLLIDFIDSVTEKLSHETPLKELTFTCNGLSANDFDTMKQIWTQRWSDSVVCEDMKAMLRQVDGSRQLADVVTHTHTLGCHVIDSEI